MKSFTFRHDSVRDTRSETDTIMQLLYDLMLDEDGILMRTDRSQDQSGTYYTITLVTFNETAQEAVEKWLMDKTTGLEAKINSDTRYRG